MNILKITHNAGFFSCCTIRLLEIIEFYNNNGKTPDKVDSSEQFDNYKQTPNQNLIPLYFNEESEETLTINLPASIDVRMDCMALQFDSYKNLNFEQIKPFIHKYFTPSMEVLFYATKLSFNYKLDFKNLCAVFYRGNDKSREMKVAPYEMFVEKAKEIRLANPDIRFLVQPDEEEFLDAFLLEFPDSIYFKETPMLKKQDSAMFFEIPMDERSVYGAKFFAAVLLLSQCKHVIMHSGNGALWLALYRENANNVHQVFNDQWI